MIKGSCGSKSMSMEKLSGELIGDRTRSRQNLEKSWSEGMITSGGVYSFRSYLNGDRVRGSTPNRFDKSSMLASRNLLAAWLSQWRWSVF